MGTKMDIMSREFAEVLLRRQLRLSAGIAAVLVALIAAVPLVNRYLPDLMNAGFLGMTVSWFLLGLAIFPILIALAWVFVRMSTSLEDEILGVVDSATLPGNRDTHADLGR